MCDPINGGYISTCAFFFMLDLLWSSILINNRLLTSKNWLHLFQRGPDVILLFSGRRRSSLEPDSVLQEALRTRLRVVESNSQDVTQLFKVSFFMYLCQIQLRIVAYAFSHYSVILIDCWFLVSRISLHAWFQSMLKKIILLLPLRQWRKSGSSLHIWLLVSQHKHTSKIHHNMLICYPETLIYHNV